MSPRAAWRLESMGFPQVFDYVPGKLDWLAMGLPYEGRAAELPAAGQVARTDVPTCRLDEPTGQVRDRVQAAGWDACVVTNDERVVLGLFRAKELENADANAPAEKAMRPGPSTYRPYVAIVEMAELMIEHNMANCPITTSDGRLVGLLRKEDAAKAALEIHQRHHHHEDDE
jgi:predicted transcriptional regulator